MGGGFGCCDLDGSQAEKPMKKKCLTRKRRFWKPVKLALDSFLHQEKQQTQNV